MCIIVSAYYCSSFFMDRWVWSFGHAGHIRPSGMRHCGTCMRYVELVLVALSSGMQSSLHCIVSHGGRQACMLKLHFSWDDDHSK
jgi:hypothetical protein